MRVQRLQLAVVVGLLIGMTAKQRLSEPCQALFINLHRFHELPRLGFQDLFLHVGLAASALGVGAVVVDVLFLLALRRDGAAIVFQSLLPEQSRL